MTELQSKAAYLLTPEFRKNILSCRFGVLFFVLLILALLAYPASLILPDSVGYENSWIENMQIAVLFACIAVCLIPALGRKKVYPAMLVFVSLIFFALILREINCGRVFYPDPVRPNRFLGKDEVWFGAYILPFRLVYAAVMIVLFFRKKVYLQMLDALRIVRLPLSLLVILFLTAAAGSVIDKAVQSFVLEEGVELVFYLALFLLTKSCVRQLSNREAKPQD